MYHCRPTIGQSRNHSRNRRLDRSFESRGSGAILGRRRRAGPAAHSKRRKMLRFFANRWSLLSLAVLVAGVSGGTVALGEHTTTERNQGVETVDGELVLHAPGLDGWNDHRKAPRNNPGQSSLFGAAFHYDAFVYDDATANPKVAGVVRRGWMPRRSGTLCTWTRNAMPIC